MEGSVPRTKPAHTHDKALGQPETTMVGTRLCIPLPHTTLLRSIAVGGTEEPRKVGTQGYILDGISVTESMEEGWMDG